MPLRFCRALAVGVVVALAGALYPAFRAVRLSPMEALRYERARDRGPRAAEDLRGRRIVALDGMDLAVAAGEFVAVVSPSGCGKSTLLHLIAALDEPDAGSIHVGGHALETHSELSHYRARHVGMIFQLHNLLPTLTAIENVQVPMFELGLTARDRRQRARVLLRAVGLEGRNPIGLHSCQAGSASVWPSLERSPTSRRSCSRTSRLGAST